MSGIVVLAPILIGTGWPMITSAAVVVMGAMGYAAVQSSVEEEVQTKVDEDVEIDLANQEEIAQNVGRGETLVFVKEDITVKFIKDIRGRMKVCVSGRGHSDAELEELGHELAGRVVQQYTYTRLLNEMQNQTGLSVVDQSVDEDNTIRIKLRNWED